MSKTPQNSSAEEVKQLTPLEVMQQPFHPSMISKLPKGSKAQNECPFEQKVRCKVCGGFHHPQMVHLDYVGHAALTQRLLQADVNWSWEPIAYDERGLPRFDDSGGLWIRLTVGGQTRLGYGDAQGKHGPNATKEAIGDALRNAAMRFGAALELWHKGDWEADTLPEPVVDDDPGQGAAGGNGSQREGARPELPKCPQDILDAELPKWSKAIQTGKKTAQQILDMAVTRYALSDAQRAQILALPKKQAIDGESTREHEGTNK